MTSVEKFFHLEKTSKKEKEVCEFGFFSSENVIIANTIYFL